MTSGHFRGCLRFSFAELKKPAIPRRSGVTLTRTFLTFFSNYLHTVFSQLDVGGVYLKLGLVYPAFNKETTIHAQCNDFKRVWFCPSNLQCESVRLQKQCCSMQCHNSCVREETVYKFVSFSIIKTKTTLMVENWNSYP